MRIYIASDHAGFNLKNLLIDKFPNYIFLDFGCSSESEVDYSDYIAPLVRKVLEEVDNVGILICGSGLGVTIHANRFPGIRAANCLTKELAELARKHNNANVLCLGARLLDSHSSYEIFQTFMKTKFLGGKHERRIEKIDLNEI